MKQPIRILQVVTVMNLGGLESFIMNIYRNIDHSKIQFDFLVHRLERGVFDDEIEELGGNIYRLNPIRPTRFFTYQKELKRFFKEHNEYRTVHSHLNENSAMVLYIAKKIGIPVRIAHSHAKATAGPYKFLREFIKTKINSYSTLNLACSVDAGKWLYGSHDFEVFKNSIDITRFKFPENPAVTIALKKQLNFESSDFVIGLIARFSSTKNHEFLIESFNAYLKINKHAKLLLIGEGDLQGAIRQKVNGLQIEDHVVFTGNVSNPEDYLCVMDLFTMTSFNEGLGIVLIEAQCNGLPILMSDTMPKEIELTGLTQRKSLHSSAKEWAEEIERIRVEHADDVRVGYEEVIRSKGFDIALNSQKLVEIYSVAYQKSLKNNL